jgi:hypothetical protein
VVPAGDADAVRRALDQLDKGLETDERRTSALLVGSCGARCTGSRRPRGGRTAGRPCGDRSDRRSAGRPTSPTPPRGGGRRDRSVRAEEADRRPAA